ncbi:MAG: hypothetical protein GTN51_12480 [Armatimonadetes bacterium]|nr:hypothetical protein [Armatimonadota bacterium]
MEVKPTGLKSSSGRVFVAVDGLNGEAQMSSFFGTIGAHPHLHRFARDIVEGFLTVDAPLALSRMAPFILEARKQTGNVPKNDHI